MKTSLKSLLCTSVLITGVAEAASVAIYPGGSVPAPHTGTVVSLADIESGALANYDSLYMPHVSGFSVDACTQLEAFLASGGGVVTEWSGVGLLFDSYGPNSIFSPAPQCALFSGVVDYGDFVANDTPINIIDSTSPVVSGLSNPFSMGGGSEFMYTVSGYDAGEWHLIADYTGHSGTWPALMSSSTLGGMIVVGTMDFDDVVGSGSEPNADTLLGNMVEYSTTGSPLQAPANPEARAIPALPAVWLAVLSVLAGITGLLGRRRLAS